MIVGGFSSFYKRFASVDILFEVVVVKFNIVNKTFVVVKKDMNITNLQSEKGTPVRERIATQGTYVEVM